MTRAKSEGPRGVTLRTRAPLETHLSQPPASLPCNAHLDSTERDGLVGGSRGCAAHTPLMTPVGSAVDHRCE